MQVRFFLFFLVLFALLTLANRYLLRRALALFGLGAGLHRAASVLSYGAIVFIAAARLLDGHMSAEVLEPAAAAAFTVVLGTVVSAVLLVLSELLMGVLRFATRQLQRLRAWLQSAPVGPGMPSVPAGLGMPSVPVVPELPPTPVAPEVAAASTIPRRAFVAQAMAGSAVAVGGGSALYGTTYGRHDYVLEEVPVKLDGLARALDGFTIVQLSDVHLGLFVGEREVRAAEERVRRARPDLLVLTGDLLDHDPAQASALGRMLRRLLPLAPRGVVVVPGNHDYYAGIDTFRASVTASGALLLCNQGVTIEGGFALLGLDDVWGPRIDPRSRGTDFERALRTVPAAADLPRVVLCHNPASFVQLAGKVSLQLSGHTHGGQVNVGIRLADLVLGHPYIAGRYERGGSQLYVNRGFGTAGPPARIGSPPEVTRIVLVRG